MTSNALSDSSDTNQEETSKTNLIINYLPQEMTQEEISSVFSIIGSVESCKLIRDKITGRSLSYGFVNYHDPKDADRAIETLNGLKLQNKTIKVSYARPSSESIKDTNLYVSGLPKSMTEQDLEALFAAYGRIITLRILWDNTTVQQFIARGQADVHGPSKGVGFVRYDRHVEATRALQELHGTTPEGFTEPIVVKFANNFGKTNAMAQGGPMHRLPGRFRYCPMVGEMGSPPLSNYAKNSPAWSIFVYNLAPETDDGDLWKLFGPFGAVLDVKIIRDPVNNKCKGFGFVKMINYDEAVSAIRSLNGGMWNNRVLQVSFKTDKKKGLVGF